MLTERRKQTVKKSIFQRALTALAAAGLALCVSASAIARQGGTTRYVYDENGRLHAVISPSGEAVVYEYDAAGNITAVRRLAADALTILAFTPHAGVAGDLVTLVGVGFGAGVQGISFNGTAARVVEVTPSTIVAEVPQGATTGPIMVTTAGGSATTATPFTVRGVRLSPTSARLLFGDSVTFTPFVSTDGDPSLTWSVSGVVGGNSAVGTITPDGVYTAPNNSGTLIIRAALTAAPDFYGEAQVIVRDPNDIAELRAPGVSVRRGLDNGTALLATSVAVQYGFSQGALAASSKSVSVQHGNADGINTARAPGTSVQYGFGDQAPPMSKSVSVGYGSAEGQALPSASVSATTGPYIASVSPASASRNTTVTLTITGANLTGVNAVRFIRADGTLDTTLTISNVSVNADGTVLTATLNVASNALTGQRVVIVVSPAADSMTTVAGQNVIQIN
jgi:YD repeat-containing protein